MTGGSIDQPKILIIDDDPELLKEIADTFSDSGFVVELSSDWAATLDLLEDNQPDVILLDQKLGRVDTLMKIPQLRTRTAAPILFFSGNRNEADRVIGLELGADDFLLKPISGRELVARVRAHLRRAHVPENAAENGNHHAENGKSEWRYAPQERRLCRPDGTEVPLTSAEFDVLSALVEVPGQAVDRDVLSTKALRRPYRAEDRALDNIVHQIRRKIGRLGAGEVIVSVRSVGYAFKGFPAT